LLFKKFLLNKFISWKEIRCFYYPLD
jgi:hypothetical protein